MVSFWDLRMDTSEEIFSNKGRVGSVQSIAVNNIATQLAAIDNKGMVRVWRVADLSSIAAPFVQQCHEDRGLKCTFSPDCSTLATTGADTTARIWGVTEDGELGAGHVFTCTDQKWVWDAKFSTDSQFLFTGSSDGTVRLWDSLRTDSPKQEYAAHQRAVVSIAFWDREAQTFYHE